MNRRMIIIAIVLALSIITPLAAPSTHVAASGFDFVGTWVNVDSQTSGLTKLQIVQSGGQFKVRGFGQCAPTDCDWGFVNLEPTGYSITDLDAQYAIATYDFGFKDMTLVVHLDGNQLVAETYSVFKDRSGRKPYRTMSLLKRIS